VSDGIGAAGFLLHALSQYVTGGYEILLERFIRAKIKPAAAWYPSLNVRCKQSRGAAMAGSRVFAQEIRLEYQMVGRFGFLDCLDRLLEYTKCRLGPGK
jgi:hypothetical protein